MFGLTEALKVSQYRGVRVQSMERGLVHRGGGVGRRASWYFISSPIHVVCVCVCVCVCGSYNHSKANRLYLCLQCLIPLSLSGSAAVFLTIGCSDLQPPH